MSELIKMIFFSSNLYPTSILVLVVTLKVFHKLWWAPNRYRRFMESQGITGPSYNLFHGNNKEIVTMETEAASKPLTSSSHNIFPRLQPDVYLWTKLYGKNYIKWNGSQAQMVITDTELVKEVLIDRNGVFLKPKPTSFLFKIFGDAIGISRGTKWARMRKLGNHAFRAERLKKDMIPLMLLSCKEMMKRLRQSEGKAVDVHKEFMLLSSDIISRAAFGSNYREGQTIFESLDKLAILASRNIFRQWISGGMRTYRDHVESVGLEKTVRKSVVGIIKKREEGAMKNDEEGFGADFLGVLLKAHHHHHENEKPKVSMEQIVQECKALYVAGQETTSATLAWTIFLLAVYPEWQEMAREEVMDLFGKQNATPDGISKLKKMNMIINESLRLYPPALATRRTIEQNVRLGKFDIQAGTDFIISILAIHHDPEIWGEDVHLFKPERFSEGVAKATKDNIAAFIPFGLGARSCLGLNFALIEAKIALAMILQRYSLTLSPSYIHSPHNIILMKPRFGVQVMLKPLSEE